jgi:hypothetical protein
VRGALVDQVSFVAHKGGRLEVKVADFIGAEGAVVNANVVDNAGKIPT